MRFDGYRLKRYHWRCQSQAEFIVGSLFCFTCKGKCLCVVGDLL